MRTRIARLPPGFVAATARCAGCAVGYLLLELLLNRLARALLAAWVAGSGAGAARPAYELCTWLLTLAVQAAALALPVAAVLALGWLPRGRLLRRPALRGATLPALALYLGAAQLGNLAANAVGQTAGSTQTLALPHSPAGLCAAFLAVCVAPALLEELLFRGAMQSLVRPYGPWVAIAAQAVLFAVLHGNLAAVLFALPAGLYFGFLAERTGSLLPSMLLHLVNNSLAFLLRCLWAAGLTSAANSLAAFQLLLFPLGAAAVLAWLLAGKKPLLRPLAKGLSPAALTRSAPWLLAAAALAAMALLGG